MKRSYILLGICIVLLFLMNFDYHFKAFWPKKLKMAVPIQLNETNNNKPSHLSPRLESLSEYELSKAKKEGRIYLNQVISTASHDLKKNDVRSKVFTDQNIVNIYSRYLPGAMLICENIEYDKKDPARSEKSANMVLAKIGIEKDKAFNESRSKKGACGIFQFKKESYEYLKELYPEARLKNNFLAGVKDHGNAAKATLLHIDSSLKCANRANIYHLLSNNCQLKEFIAVSFNQGVTRTIAMVKKHGRNWPDMLNKESKAYVKKFKIAQNLLS
jgi:hypothetical protein